MIIKYFDGVIPEYKGRINSVDGELEDLAKSVIKNYELALDDLRITEAITYANDLVNRANKYIDETMPWVLAKEGKTDELASVMNHLANAIFISGMLLKPVLVKASDKLFSQLGLQLEEAKYEKVYDFGCISGIKVNKGDQLFPRLDAAQEVAFIQELMSGKKE